MLVEHEIYNVGSQLNIVLITEAITVTHLNEAVFYDLVIGKLELEAEKNHFTSIAERPLKRIKFQILLLFR